MSIMIRVGNKSDNAALDLGFGTTIGKRGDQEIIFPSVTGPSRQLLDSSLKTKDPLTHMIDLSRGQFVGDLAIRQSATKNFSLKDRKAEQNGIHSILELALATLYPQQGTDGINLTSGLPVTFYFDQKEELQQLLQGDHVINALIGDRHIQKIVSIQDVQLLPQPLGSALDYLLDEDGKLRADRKQYAMGRIGVLDIGFFTNDLLVLDHMEVIREESRSLRSGMAVALKAMADAGIDLPIFELDKKVRSGRYAGARKKAYAALSEQILGEMETYWRKMDLILVTGGGGMALYDNLESKISEPCEKLGQMCIVRGYGKAGRRRWG